MLIAIGVLAVAAILIALLVSLSYHSAEWHIGYAWATSDPAHVRSYVNNHQDAMDMCYASAGVNADGNHDFYEGCLAGVHDITGK